MDVLSKLRCLLEERGWSEYRLAQEAGLNQSTISNIYRRNTVPTIATLEAVCYAFGLTLSQFFAEGDSDLVEITPELKELLDAWGPLTQEQRKTVLQVARSYHRNSLRICSPLSALNRCYSNGFKDS